jgi:hypothetical protein
MKKNAQGPTKGYEAAIIIIIIIITTTTINSSSIYVLSSTAVDQLQSQHRI